MELDFIRPAPFFFQDAAYLTVTIEQVLKRHKIYYTKSEVWIESEKLYEVLYETEV